MPSLDAAYNWVIKICNDDSYGYGQYDNDGTSVRNGVKSSDTGLICFDCSSLMYYAVTNKTAKDGSGGKGGWDITGWSSYSKSNAWYTGNECDGLEYLGWVQHPATDQWQKGDILWRSGHTEMVYKVSGKTGYTMGAHARYSNNRAKEISINSTVSSSSRWTYLYRAPDKYQDIGTSGSTSQTSGTDDVSAIDWWYSVTSAQPLSSYYGTTKQDNNARKIAAYFLDKGFTYAAICGLLGNISYESWLNPGQMEVGYGGSTAHGYGFIQWTPATGLTKWANSKGTKWYDGDTQCEFIYDEIMRGSESYEIHDGNTWLHTSSYSYTGSEFAALSSYEEATYAYFYERERGTWSDLRLEIAKYYWNYFKTNKVNTSSTTTGTSNDSTNDGSGSSSNKGYVGQARAKVKLSTNKVMVLYQRRF